MKYRKYILLFFMFVVYIVLIVYTFMNIDSYTSTGSVISGKSVTVIIDAGHGGEDGGAVANGIVEKDINLSITKKLSRLLELSGINVRLTRSSDKMIDSGGETLRQRKVSDMKNRLEIYNQSEENVVISIHQNKFPQSKYSGAQVFYSQNNTDSLTLAESIRSNLCALLQADNKREIKPADKNIYLLCNARIPAVIVECGFLSNPEEAALLNSEEYQNKLAFAVFTGFMEYYNR